MREVQPMVARVDWFLHEAFGREQSKLYSITNSGLVVVILYAVAVATAESIGDLATRYERFFAISEYIVVAIFIVEYIANIYVAPRKRAYIFGPWGIIDFLAIAPSLVNALDLTQLKVGRVLRVLRFLRILRILKLTKNAAARYQESKTRTHGTLRIDLEIYFVTMFSVLVISSTLMHYAEESVAGTLFTDIPTAMWWSITTMTTVGYGDMVPVTPAGRTVAGVTALCGLALFGLLRGVLGKAMVGGLFGPASADGPALSDEAGTATTGVTSALDRLESLGTRRDKELISDEEFERERQDLLSQI
jgi:voltage-gated potassium channel